MNKREINVLDYASEILKAVNKGVLITSKFENKVNSMTISWGTLGIEWAKPIFIAFIREHRYTRELLEKGTSFTINIPMQGSNRKPIGYLGTKSGRDRDKLKDMNLTLVPSDIVDAPAIKEYPLTLECRIVYKQLQDRNALAKEKMVFYPQDVPETYHDRNKDFHVAFYGEIEKAYIIED